MKAVALTVVRQDLVNALRTLGTIRKKRFASIVPVWLRFDAGKGLSITEARRGVTAVVQASGEWSPAGATLDLFALRRVAETLDTEIVELILSGDSILIPTSRGHVRLALQPFGPESRRGGAR